MAVKIRLTRRGSKKKPFYRVVVAHVESPRDGDFLEILGTYDPMQNPHKVELKGDRVTHWLKEGAIPTNTVANLIKKAGISDKDEQAA